MSTREAVGEEFIFHIMRTERELTARHRHKERSRNKTKSRRMEDVEAGCGFTLLPLIGSLGTGASMRLGRPSTEPGVLQH